MLATDASVKDDVIEPFRSEIALAQIADHWGRLGVECYPPRRPLGQWLFFGTYLDPQNHQIEFKVPNEAEFAIFFDIEPAQRSRLAALVGLDGSIGALNSSGFEFNLPRNRGNSWRVCYWRKTMRDLVGSEPIEVTQLLQEQLDKLFKSEFYKIARDASAQEGP
jgi:hypothetical protein